MLLFIVSIACSLAMIFTLTLVSSNSWLVATGVAGGLLVTILVLRLRQLVIERVLLAASLVALLVFYLTRGRG